MHLRRIIRPGAIGALLLAWAGLAACPPLARAGDDGFKPLFNGKDLTGWVNVNCNPGTFFARDGMIITTGRPTGYLRTEKQYENFVLEFDWMHQNKKAIGNSGLFVWADPLPSRAIGYTRGIEVQVLVNLEYDWATSHGDIFSIHGATCIPDRPHPTGIKDRCLPSERRAKGGGEWNHYKVTGNNGVIKLEVNGKEVSGVHHCNPRKGYLALESEGAECWFKNIKLKELPSTNPKPSEICDVDKGWKYLFAEPNLGNWKLTPDHGKHWRMGDVVLNYDGKLKYAKDFDPNLWSKEQYGDFEMMLDWRFDPKNTKKLKHPVILPSGDYEKDANGKNKEIEVADAGDSGVYLRGSSKSQVNLWCWPIGSGEVYGYRMDPKMSPEVRAGVTPKMKADNPLGQWNRMFIKMKGDRLTVRLNGKTVIENAQLPGVAPRGPIALQHHGDPLQFANVFIRELGKDE